MMRRNNRRKTFNIQNEKESNRVIFITSTVLILAIVSFTITFVIYRNYLNKQTEIAEIQKIAELNKENKIGSSEASSSIGKTINEVKEESENDTKKEVSKIPINIVNVENNNEEEQKSEEIKTTANNTEDEKEVEEIKEEKLPDPVFKMPVSGEITNGFAKDSLIYSNTLQEWVTHTGIDIKADKTTVVKASSDGIVKSIKNDPRYGISVVIEHTNGYESVYSNLLTAEFVKEGENVEQGQTIGTVGNTATFEIADSSHLHFEILKDGEYLNPELYLK